MKSKVLYFCGDMSRIGGIEKYNRDFVSALELSGLQVRVIQRRPGGVLSKIRFVIECFSSIVFFRPNYIVCGHLYFSPIALFAKIVFKVPFALSLYGIEAICIENPIYKKAVCTADTIVVISEYTKELITKQFVLDGDKFFMLISCVDESICYLLPDREKLKAKYGLQGKPVVLTLSRLSTGEEKGQHRVLAAMPAVLARYPDAKYVVAGPGVDERLSAVLVAQPMLSDSLICLGPTSEEQKLELYNLCDVFILPSKNEGFGIVFIEALACGTPVIASDAYGCREGLRDGHLGRLVDPDDLRAISDAILDALADTQHRSEEERKLLRDTSLNIYGYTAWCEKVNVLAERISAV